MCAQNRSWKFRADLAFQAGLHRSRLSKIGNDCEYFPGFENLTHRHRKRLFWHLRDVGEPSFAYLLLAARCIEINNDVWLLALKICGRIIKCNVTVFTNTEEGDVDWIRSQS